MHAFLAELIPCTCTCTCTRTLVHVHVHVAIVSSTQPVPGEPGQGVPEQAGGRAHGEAGPGPGGRGLPGPAAGGAQASQGRDAGTVCEGKVRWKFTCVIHAYVRMCQG